MEFLLEPEVAPDMEPITLAEMKSHLRVTETVDDDNITALIEVSRQWAEDFTSKAFIDQTWRMTVGTNLLGGDSVSGRAVYNINDPTFNSYWAKGQIVLRRTPVIELVSIESSNTGESPQSVVLDPTSYTLYNRKSRWPYIGNLNGSPFASGRMEIVFRAGFVDTTQSPQNLALVPNVFKQAIKLHCEAMYDRDEKMMSKLIEAAQNLLRPFSSNLQMA